MFKEWARHLSTNLSMLSAMPRDIAALELNLLSENKEVRLKALKLLLRHPDATPLQLVRSLCSEDNRNLEFLHTFELDAAMRESWNRLNGVTDESVYEFLSSLYLADRSRNLIYVVHVLRLLCTCKALDMLHEIHRSAPVEAHETIQMACSHISHQLASENS